MASPDQKFEGITTGTDKADCRRAHVQRVRHQSGWGLEDKVSSAPS